MSGGGLLEPGAHRARGVADDAALVAAMLRVEVAWLRALPTAVAAKADHVEAVVRAADGWQPTWTRRGRGGGNPVLPLRARRCATGSTTAPPLGAARRPDQPGRARHRADAARAGRVAPGCGADLDAAQALAGLADEHRGRSMVGRTLTQHAVPITFGLKAAQWLTGVLDAATASTASDAALPVQCGGAAGTLSLAADWCRDPAAPRRRWPTARAGCAPTCRGTPGGHR